jgi:cellulose synthase/poly-beta-1,6-N-acetylglucosamine synthase-like glycosyltransferase
MESAGQARAAVVRSAASFAASAGSPSIDPSLAPWPAEPADFGTIPIRCPEIDCVRERIAADVAEAAGRRAAALGVGADRVLIAAGVLSEENYLRALADALGVAFEPLDGVPRALCPLNDERLIESAAAGILPLLGDDGLSLVVAPRGVAARRIAGWIADNSALTRRFRFTSAERLNRFVLRHGGKAIATRAAGKLTQAWPVLSAAPPRWRAHIVSAAVAAMMVLAAAVMAPAGTMLIFDVTLASVFMAWIGLRFSVAFADRPASNTLPELTDDALPVYTVIAALYREAASVDGLLAAIERLDYPREKLDVIIAVEVDDDDTRAAIAGRRNRLPVTVIPVPMGGPRTKPRALNAALPFARGTFTVIYDAEDRPEPDQLRHALQTFCASGDDLACVQARLSIDNTADSWLARLFTAEYAGQFDVFLPGLAAIGLPLPLGGSSNHFHTAVLRAVHGWDAYNVTEDADLGMRLARFGYRSEVIGSTTYEEAPAQLAPWLRQRTRWFKGWMQTWAVHMRKPRRLMRDLGPLGFFSFQLIVGGNALAALVHPLLIAGLAYAAISGIAIWRTDSVAETILVALYGTTVVAGYLTSVFLGWLGLKRRGLLGSAWVLVLTPVHWLLLSLAAWRALYQFVFAPYAWEKTAHGLAKSSRLATRMACVLLALERDLSRLKKTGDLPALANEPPARRVRQPITRRRLNTPAGKIRQARGR